VGTAIALVALSSCSKKDSVAELVAKAGVVDANRGAEGKAWNAVDAGATFVIGDAVRTGPAANARIKLVNGAALLVAESSIVRFAAAPEHGERGFRLSMETGSAELETGASRMAFDTTVGRAVLAESTRIKLTARDGDLTLAVLVGSAQLEGEDGTRTINAGESISIDIGSAQLIEPDAAPIPDAPPPDAAPPPATIQANVKGRKVRAQKPNSDEWDFLPQGPVELERGTRLQLPGRTSVRVSDGDEAALVRGKAEVIVGAADALIDATGGGSLTIEALSQDLTAKVPGGLVTARSRKGGSAATVAVTKGNGATNLRVTRGELGIHSGDVDSVLKIGETAVLSPNGQLVIANQAPSVTDLTIRAGETAILHDRRGRTAVRVNFAQSCPGEGRVEVSNRLNSFAQSKSVAEGSGSTRVWAERGSNYYRVLCLVDGVPTAKAAASGHLVVRRDSGMARLPKKATANRVEADGRFYRILYQNLLPVLTFTWKKAPPAPGYKLILEPTSGDRIEVAGTQANHTFKAGQLREGTYRFWFEPDGSTRKSKIGTIAIQFDNAAPTAYIRSPAHGARWEGKIRVTGVALEGWNVSIGGAPVPLDKQHRFDTTMVPPAEEQAIAIRLSHSSRGTHYYLRRRGK